MGDRVSVTLSVPTAQAEEAEALMKKYDGEANEAEEFDDFTDYQFEEVNYGNLDCEEYLTAAGIAWIKSWDAGGGFTAGTEWVMFNEDGSLHATAYNDASPEDILSPFFRLLDKPEELLAALREKQVEYTSPPWDNQVEYGKRYRTVQLITPSVDTPA